MALYVILNEFTEDSPDGIKRNYEYNNYGYGNYRFNNTRSTRQFWS